MEYKIPLFDLNFDNAEEEAVVEVLRSKWISSGPKTIEFESLFARMLNVDYSLALTNCTVSLHLALQLLEIGEGDEVICPSLTFVATVNAIRYVGAVPVFADIGSYDDLTIDPPDIEQKVTPKTKAIIVMHYGGFSCEMDSIIRIARKHNLKIIEDACHGPLSEYKGRKLGTMGDIGCFSFFSNKNISTGEGGMLVTNNRALIDRGKLLRSHGMTTMSYERAIGHSSEYDVVNLGYNYRIDDIRSALGIVQLNKLESDIRARAGIREIYLDELNDIEEISIPFRNNRMVTSNYIMPVVLKDADSVKRDKVRNMLGREGIQTSVHYPAVHRFSIYRPYYVELPKTEYIADCLITLPMYSSLQRSQIKFIADTLRTILRGE